MGEAHAAFLRAAGEAGDNAELQRLLHEVTGRFMERRRLAAAAVPDWEALREHARQMKAATLASLDEHLVTFERQVIARGGHVHWASTAADARRIVLDLARQHGARTVVKSKSMVSEEIHLNAELSGAGITPIETDLGEYIIQLAGERPSHVIAPALHKSRGDVSRLFTEKLGLAPTDDVEVMTAAARSRLRRAFLSADLGISGVNLAVAETGTLVIVENEGNARLSTSAPRVHVALMGIEKVIPRLADVPALLTLLPRSATGQAMTSYVSFITGPRRSGELDGPEALHVVLLDNGRTTLLADPGTREALQCIRCGACQNACPVYSHIGGHAYGGVYAGPIGAMIAPVVERDRAPADLPFASTLCGACAEVCPVKIRIPEVLLRQRAQVMAGRVPAEALPSRRAVRAGMRAWAAAMATPARYGWASRVLRWTRPLLGAGVARRLSGPLRAWAAAREVPVPAARSFQQWWRARGKAGGGDA